MNHEQSERSPQSLLISQKNTKRKKKRLRFLLTICGIVSVYILSYWVVSRNAYRKTPQFYRDMGVYLFVNPIAPKTEYQHYGLLYGYYPCVIVDHYLLGNPLASRTMPLFEMR